MDGFWASNWGNWVSLGGLIVSLGGLVVVFFQARKARIASQAAQQVATQTSERIARYLQTVSLERAIAATQRVKLLHRFGAWEASLEQYQVLRTLITEIVSRMGPKRDQHRRLLVNDQALLRSIEREVSEQVGRSNPPNLSANFHRAVDQIQTDLESLTGGSEAGDAPREQR